MRLILILSLLLLSSCTTTPQVVNIPVVSPIYLQIPKKPKLYSSALSLNSSAMSVEKAHVADMDILITYSNNLINIMTEVNKHNGK